MRTKSEILKTVEYLDYLTNEVLRDRTMLVDEERAALARLNAAVAKKQRMRLVRV